MDIQEHFINTYKNNTWGDNESRSGPGSNLNSDLVKETVNFVIKSINKYYKDFRTITICDIPCGDFNYINVLLQKILDETNCKEINYYAYDIVPEIKYIFENNLKKIQNVNYNFQVFDATKDIVAKCDIILCKEMFIHLSFDHIKSCITNFKNSGSTYLICNDFDHGINKDIQYECLGECRIVCLMKDPFNLPKSSYCENNYKLWNLENI